MMNRCTYHIWWRGVIVALGLALVVSVSPGQAQAQFFDEDVEMGKAGALGVGLGVSTFTSGVSAKYYLFDRHAVQGIFGFWGTRGFSLGADYLVEFEPLTETLLGNLVAGVGAGGAGVFFISGGDVALLAGVNGLGALAWQFDGIPLEIAIELRPTVLFGAFVSGFYLGTGAAIRYYF